MSADKPDVAALIDSGALAEAANRLRFERSRYCEKLADACDEAAAALQSQQAENDALRADAVPREPTPVMLTAGWQQVTTALCEDGNPASLCNLWRAMYDAARAKWEKP